MAQSFKIMPSVPLQLGWIPFWNLHPLKVELERLAGPEIEFLKGTPTTVNKWLAEGKVSLAPCSSVCLLKNAGNEIAFPLGIAASGAVSSVYIGLRQEDAGLLELIRTRQHALREIFKVGQARYDGDARKLAAHVFKHAAALPAMPVDVPPPLTVTPASATSAQLARILYRLWFGESAYETRAAETGNAQASSSMSLRRPMELLIGDEALAKRGNYRVVIDLGDAWRELTDLPFVFAVFQTSKKTISAYWRQKILEAAEIAQARMRVESCHYMPDMPPVDVAGHPIDLASYWKLIQYRLGPSHFKGLALYLAMARVMSPQASDDQAVVNITRWEALGAGEGSRV